MHGDYENLYCYKMFLVKYRIQNYALFHYDGIDITRSFLNKRNTLKYQKAEIYKQLSSIKYTTQHRSKLNTINTADIASSKNNT